MKTTKSEAFTSRFSRFAMAALLLAGLLGSQMAHAQSGSWTNLNGGSWAAGANWNDGVIASGSDNTADFSQRTLTGVTTVRLDGARTIGNLLFGDLGNIYGWTLATGTGGPLTLSVGSGSPTVTVNGQVTTLSNVIAGTQGLTKTGPGTLAISAINTYLGGTILNQGTVSILTTNGSLGAANTNTVRLNNATIAATFPSSLATVNVLWPITVDAGGGKIELLQAGNNGRWQFAANTLSGAGTLTLKPNATRFIVNDQSVSGFSGKWIIDGSGRLPSATSGFINLNTLAGDNCFGATPVSFTPDAITLINNGVLVNFNAVGDPNYIGSATRGITIGSGGGQLFVGGPRNFVVNGQISGTTGDPLYFTANNNNAGAQLNKTNTYNGNSVIQNLATVTSRVWLRMGTNNPVPHGPGKGLVAFSSSIPAGLAVLDLAGFDATINGFGASSASSVVDNLVGGGTSATTGSSFTNSLTVGTADTTSSFAGSIRNTTNTLNLVKIGSGILTLSGTNTYTGSTVVSAGELVIASPVGQQAGGSYTVADTAALSINVSSNSPSIPMSDLTLGASSGANLSLNFNSNPSLTVAPVTATNLTANAVTLNLNFGGGVAVGQYPVIFYPGAAIGGAGFGAITLVTSPSAMTAVLTNNTANNSIDVNVLVAPSISVSLASSANPCVRGQAVTFTATATVSGSPGAGTVTFKNGSATMGTGVLNPLGIATFTTNFATLGTYPITASFSGSTSLPVDQAVNPGLDLWTGASSGAWDILTSSNWLAVGAPARYYEGDSARFDDTATGSTAVTLNVQVNPGNVLFSNSAKAYSLSGSGAIAGATGFVKDGSGTLTINNTNIYTGDTVISNGVVTFAGTGGYTGSGVPGRLNVGIGGKAVLSMTSSGALAFSRVASLGGLTGGTNDIGSGAILQTSGTIALNTLSGGVGFIALPLEIGAGGSGTYGYYGLSGGALNTLPLNATDAQSIRVASGGLGVFTQTGGTLSDVGFFDLGNSSVSGGNGGTGVASFLGGSATIGNAIRIGVQLDADGAVNIGTLAGGNSLVTGSSVVFLAGTTATNGVLNLNAGTLQLSGAISRNAANGVGAASLNLNGATLRATSNNQNLLDGGLNNVTLFNGGIVLDIQGSNGSATATIANPAGNGIYRSSAIPISSGGGSGYLGEPIVTVTGGSGSGAMAVASLAGGVVSSVTFTCPGANYAAGDTLVFNFAGGGASTPATSFNYVLSASDLSANTLGNVVKTGPGTLTVNGYNSYTGITIVSNGTLRGIGVLSGPVLVQSGGSIGGGENASIGALNLGSTLNLGGTVNLRIDKTGGFTSSDTIQGMTQVTYGGTLSITNITSDGTPLAPSDKFTLFSASSGYTSNFNTFNLPPLPGGLAWDTTQLAVDGSIQITGSGVNPNPTNITINVTSTNMTLNWPSDHTGWQLQAQTNALGIGLSTNWISVPGSTATNSITIPIDPASGAVFFRMVYP